MGVVYQLTFFLALGLLAIVIAIFVFAVSQIGRATESASREQQDILLKQKEAKGRQIEKIQGQLEEARKVGHLDETRLLKELENTKEEIAGYDTELKRLQQRIMLIRRKGAVVWPGAFFLAALVLTITASGLAEGQDLAALSLWIISIGTLTFGIFRVYRTLGAIEEVTITSQEAIETLPEAVKVALRELEEEKKPKLEFTFEDAQPPFHITCGGQIEVKYWMAVMKGEVARRAEVAFFAPPGFDFPDRDTWLQPEEHRQVGGCITTSIECGDLTKGITYRRTITIKAPSSPGSFTLKRSLVCEGFNSGYEEFEVVVE